MVLSAAPMPSTLAATPWTGPALMRLFLAAVPLFWVLAAAVLRLLRPKHAAAPPQPRKTSSDCRRAARKSRKTFDELGSRASSDDDAASTSAGSSTPLESDTDGDLAGDSGSCSGNEEASGSCRISVTMLLSMRPKAGPSPQDGLRAAHVGAEACAGGAPALATSTCSAETRRPRSPAASAGSDRWESLRSNAPNKSGSQAVSTGADRWESLRSDTSSRQGGQAASAVEDRWEALRPRGRRQATTLVDAAPAYASATSTVARPCPASSAAVDALLAKWQARASGGPSLMESELEAEISSTAVGHADAAQDDASSVDRASMGLDAAPWRQRQVTPPAPVSAPGSLSGAAMSMGGFRPMRRL